MSIVALEKPRRERSSHYLKWIRTQLCLVIACRADHRDLYPCVGNVEAHHVIPTGGGIMGSKVSDKRTVPLCAVHHRMAQTSRVLFETGFRISLEEEIDRLNNAYKAPHPVERKPSSRLTHVMIKCCCGQEHRLPPSKLIFMSSRLRFWCVSTSKWEDIEL